MRILYVTNDVPWPLTSGYLRHFHFIRTLSQDHAVTLLALEKPGHDPDDPDALAPYTERVVTVPTALGRGAGRDRSRARLAAILAGGDPAARQLGGLGAALHAETPFDAVLISGKRSFPVLRELPPLPLVTDLCDATSLRLRREVRHARWGRRLPLALEHLEVRRVERALIGRSQHVIFASARDRDAILDDEDRARAAIVPNGVDLAYWRRNGGVPRPGSIVLTGAMDYPPNVDAAIHLVEEILPRVRSSVPDATVSIVGRDPSPAVQRLASRPRVVVTGYVDDVRPYLESATVFAAPIRFGAGIQNKVLEALAMEVPVVATPNAADGLRMESAGEPPIDIAIEPGEFAARIVARLQAGGQVDQEPAMRRAYVAQHFDWVRGGERIASLLADAADRVGGHALARREPA